MRKNLKRYTAMLLTVIMTAPGNTAYANIEGNYDISSGAEENGSKREKSDKNSTDRKKVENSENSQNSTSGSAENGDKKDTASGNTEDGNKKDAVSGGTENENKKDTTSSGIENGEKKDVASGDTENGDKKDTTSSGAESGDKKDSASGDAGEGGKDASSENASSGGSSLKDEKGENGDRFDEATDEEEPKKGQNGGSLSELEEEEELEEEPEEIEEVEEIEELQKASPSELEEPLEEERKILSWKWNDEQEALIDGELQLAVTEEDQITFEEIVSMLPESIQAKVSENGEKSEVEIGIANWTCKSYQPDEEGKWPTTGEFFFVAELEEEYEMDEDAGELQVRVTMEEPGVVPLADTLSGVIAIYTSGDTWVNSFQLNGSGIYNGNGYKIEKKEKGSYKLTLNNMNAPAIDIFDGTWEIELKGDSILTGSSKGRGLIIDSSQDITFTGDGTLEITGKRSGLDTGSGTTTMQGSGKITVCHTEKTDNLSQYGALRVCSGGTLKIENGTLELDGASYGLVIAQKNGKVSVEGGEVTAKGETAAFYSNGPGILDIKDGRLTCSGRIIQSNSGNQININGQDAALIADDGISNASGCSVHLSSGILEINGRTCEMAGEFSVTGGTLTGAGDLGDKKLTPVINLKPGTNTNLTVGDSVDPAGFFKVPDNANIGTLNYVVSNEAGAAHIDETGKLIADSAGTVKLKAISAGTGLYNSAEAEIVLAIGKIKLEPTQIEVSPYNGTYDGASHPAITGIKLKDGTDLHSLSGIEVEYALYDEKNPSAELTYSEKIPQIKHISDSGKKCKIRISGNNYEGCELESGEVEIQKYDISTGSFLQVSLASGSGIYTGKAHTPQPKGYMDEENDSPLFELHDGISDFTVEWVPAEGAALTDGQIINVGTYHMKLIATANGDFSGEREFRTTGGTYQVTPRLLITEVTGAIEKVYDATKEGTNISGAENLKVRLCDEKDESWSAPESLSVDLTNASFEYADKNAGTGKEVTISGAVLTGRDAENYLLPTIFSANIGTITPAPLSVTGAAIAPKAFNNTTKADVRSVEFYGLKGNDTLDNSSYTATAQFSDPNAGTGKEVSVSVTLNDSVKNYTLDADKATYTLTNQTILKTFMFKTQYQSEYFSYGVSGAKEITLDTYQIPNYGSSSAKVSKFYDPDGILAGDTVKLNGGILTIYLAENDATKIGKQAKMTLVVTTTNYQDVTYEITIKLRDKENCRNNPETNLTFVPNPDDETFTAVIQPVDGAEYSFDGENWSDVNEKKDCLGGTSYTGYIRMKETDEVKAGTAASETKEAPMQTVKTPVVNPAGGAFQGTVSVEITCQTPDAEIYYTTDGSEPSWLSNRYTGAFTLSESAEVKAIAVKDHMNDSAAAQATFEKQTPAQPGDSGNASGNSGNSGSTGGSGNAGNSGSTGGSGSSGGSGHSGGSSGSSSSSGTSNGPSAGQNSGQTTSEPKRGQVNSVTGIITGNGSGYSRWEAVSGNTDANTNTNTSADAGTNANAGINTETSMNTQQVSWKLRYADGSYAQGEWKTRADGSTYEQPVWEMVNGRWYAFGADALAKAGWIHDESLGGWFYIDINHGMQTGWNLIDGKWYYFQVHSDGKMGIMYSGQRTPDGYYVDENGVWDGKAPVV